jgi:MIP family channel proteins
MKAYLAEAIGTFALIFVGIAAISNSGLGGGLLLVALAHGLTIAVMASATAAISGGHLNPAVSLGLWVGGKMSLPEMLKYWASQLVGALAAGLLALALFGEGTVITGTPTLGRLGATETPVFAGIIIEAVLTFFLVFVVYGTAVDEKGPKIGALAIGLTLTIGILVGGPATGAALNPARWMGPALATVSLNNWISYLVYWVGPLSGGAAAGLVYGRYFLRKE